MGEIERMVNDAEAFKEEDEKQKERISAKNNLESYCFNMKSTLDDEKLKDKIGESDRETITKKCDEIIKWLDANQLAEVEEFQDKQKEVEGILQSNHHKTVPSSRGSSRRYARWYARSRSRSGRRWCRRTNHRRS